MSHSHHDSHAAAPVRAAEHLSEKSALRLISPDLPLSYPQAKVAGEPTPFLSDPTAASTTRCKRRFNDLSLLRLDALARECGPVRACGSATVHQCSRPRAPPIPPSLPSSSPPCLALAAHSYVGKDARFQNKAELFGLVRERYLLFVKCVFGAQSARSARVRLRACARRLCVLEARGASVQR